MSDTSRDTAQDIRSAFHEVRGGNKPTQEDASDVARRAGSALRGVVDSVSEEITSSSKTLSDQINAKPVQSALIALGAGFLLGKLLRR